MVKHNEWDFLGIGSFKNLYDSMEEDIESGKTKVANVGKLLYDT